MINEEYMYLLLCTVLSAFAHTALNEQRAPAQLVTKQLKSEGAWASVGSLKSPTVQLDAM